MFAMQAIDFRNEKQHFGQQSWAGVRHASLAKALELCTHCVVCVVTIHRRRANLASCDRPIQESSFYNFTTAMKWTQISSIMSASCMPRKCLASAYITRRSSLPSPRLEAHSALPPCLHQVAFSNTTLPAVIPLSLR
jgi:hypothetical protein